MIYGWTWVTPRSVREARCRRTDPVDSTPRRPLEGQIHRDGGWVGGQGLWGEGVISSWGQLLFGVIAEFQS